MVIDRFLFRLKTQKNLKLLGVIAILGASLAISGFAVQDAIAASANKTVYDTDSMDTVFAGAGYVTLAEVMLKSAKPTDVLILYNEECSLYTEVNLKSHKSKDTEGPGDELDTARAAQMIQLYVDDTPVGGQITMCDRLYGIETNILNQIQDNCGDEECPETFLNSWISTKSAHGWNWVVLNLGQDPDFNTSGDHHIEVKGTYVDLDDTPNETNICISGDDPCPAVVVGERSLIVIKTHLDSGAE